ncbi:hypothetical protein D9M72_377310 [compost metagenome]
MASGTLALTATVVHEVASKAGKPDSIAVGTSGSAGRRVLPVTASALSLPPRMWASVVGGFSNISWICPASRSFSAAVLPL